MDPVSRQQYNTIRSQLLDAVFGQTISKWSESYCEAKESYYCGLSRQGDKHSAAIYSAPPHCKTEERTGKSARTCGLR